MKDKYYLKKPWLPALALMLAVICFFGFAPAGVSAGTTWDSFRGNLENNAVVDFKTPVTGEDSALYWAQKFGTSWGDMPGCPLLIDGDVICTAQKKIYRLDSVTGEVLASGQMTRASDYNIIPPVYGDGKIFVALSNGTVQAFDANTLESLWIYKNATGGQCNCPLTYYKGYVYTGFWKSYTADADFVCISAADGDPAKTDESKTEEWKYTSAGGYYWAGCYVNDNYLLIGTADGIAGGDEDEIAGSSGASEMLSLNPRTGAKLDSVENLKGDIRCSVCYDEASNLYYFTSTGGGFYRVAVNSDGTFDDSTFKTLDLGSRCTSTPVVYNGRAYVGTMGTAQFTQYDGHAIAVIDLASWQIAYSCPTQGYPQTSGLLTTAYEADSGYVYIYFFDNYNPGKLRVVKDKPGQTSMISDSAYAPILFTPGESQRQYCICSPIADEYGTLYFKNDSCNIMALGSAITRIEVTQQPNKTEYTEGEVFDPTGMKVTAYYKNGCTRDITDYISFVEDGKYVAADEISKKLTVDDLDIGVYFTYVMYHDTDDGNNGNDNNKSGQVIDKPSASVELTVKPDIDQTAVDAVIAQINKLNGNITESGVSAARAAYDALSAAQKAKVTNYAKLTAAEETVKDKPFSDVHQEWFAKAAYFSYWNGMIKGTSSTEFAPEVTASRAMLVTILYRYENKPAVSGTAPFTDLKSNWYKDAVLWAYQNDIVAGVSQTEFAPDDDITREQMVSILYRYSKNYKKIDVSATASIAAFPDSGSVSKYAVTPVKWAVAKGYISGDLENGVNYLHPQGNATRAQVASVMMRYVQSF